jgi:phospho-N-acetylmuramoyl-pentapeptide-transferase
MGDTGSLTIGGIIAVLAIAVRKEMLIPLLCGIFWSKIYLGITSKLLQIHKKRFGEGRRIFLMSHHHYQKKGYRKQNCYPFWIVAIMLAILSIVTLKLR